MDDNKPVTRKKLQEELKRFATKKELREELKRFATKKELQEELKRFATKDDLKRFATKSYLCRVENGVKDLREYVHGIETRIQAQFETQTAEFDVKLDTKLSKIYTDLVSQ